MSARHRSLIGIGVVVIAVCGACSTPDQRSGSGSSSAGSTAASSGRSPGDAPQVVLRMRPVLQGPEPVGGGPAGPATATSAAGGAPTTLVEAAAEYTGLSCENPNPAGDVSAPEDYVADCSEDATAKYLLGPVVVDSGDIVDARAGTQQTTGEP